MKLEKIFEDIENKKAKLLQLRLGRDDESIVRIGCQCVGALLKASSRFKGQAFQYGILKENLLGIYAHLLKTKDIRSYAELEKLRKASGAVRFYPDWSAIHRTFAANALENGDDPGLEYHLKKMVQFNPSSAHCRDLCQLYMDRGVLSSALLSLQQYRGPRDPALFCKRLYCLNKLCDFEALEREIPKLRSMLAHGDTPCHLLFLKWIGLDNQVVFEATRNYQKPFEGRQDFAFSADRDPGRRLRIGYIGSNFVSHAQSHQFGKTFFGDHCDQFDVFIYSLRGKGNSQTEENIRSQVQAYIDLRKVTDEEAAKRIRQDRIDILVNCNGHADDRRPYEILCHRVAPIQIDYLGYPGTSGASYIDYYVGDGVSTPPEVLGPYFSEKLIVLPGSYQITEHEELYADLETDRTTLKQVSKVIRNTLLEKRSEFQNVILERSKKEIFDEIGYVYRQLCKQKNVATSFADQVAWLQAQIDKKAKLDQLQILSLTKCLLLNQTIMDFMSGDEDAFQQIVGFYMQSILPSEAFVRNRFIFCSLNHHVKISRKDVTCWNEILRQVEGSVLVIFLMFSIEPRMKLLDAFDPALRDRIYFVGHIPKSLHLHRLRAMDCILDTMHYGAHTSAGDALWAQVPVVTCLGGTMESRVCSSMLHAAGIPEIAAADVDGYIKCAVRCATDRDFYADLLVKLKMARKSPLFDRQLYIRHLKQGYRMAWRRFCDGQEPDHLYLN